MPFHDFPQDSKPQSYAGAAGIFREESTADRGSHFQQALGRLRRCRWDVIFQQFNQVFQFFSSLRPGFQYYWFL